MSIIEQLQDRSTIKEDFNLFYLLALFFLLFVRSMMFKRKLVTVDLSAPREMRTFHQILESLKQEKK
jgi:hypothetical protein